MNIVISGSRVQVYGEDVQTFKELPVGSYDVCFNKMTGFYLTPRHELSVKEEKIYGNHEEKVAKVLRSFEATDRNFGIILSGQKGIGKSLFARILASQGAEKGLPVITVAGYIPGIADFISSIEQEVIVIFDEFEKTFRRGDDFDPQEEMLSLFDGIDNGKKLFVITCNETHKLNSYLMNRPGRFHYHFTITNPSEDEVREYLTDNLKSEFYGVIEKVVSLANTINITYDYLRAICFEINQGYSLQETLCDLNIMRTSDIRFDVTLKYSNGELYTCYGKSLDLYSNREEVVRCYGGADRTSILCWFTPSKVVARNGQLTIDPANVRTSIDEDDYWDEDDEVAKEKIAAKKAMKLESMTFQKVDDKFFERYLV